MKGFNISDDIRSELDSIVVFLLDTPLISDSKLCRSCFEHVKERMDIKAKLQGADQRIRKIYYKALLERARSSPDFADRMLESGRSNKSCRDKHKRAALSDRCATTENSFERQGSFKHDKGNTKEDYISMYRLEKELWDDNGKKSDKENM